LFINTLIVTIFGAFLMQQKKTQSALTVIGISPLSQLL